MHNERATRRKFLSHKFATDHVGSRVFLKPGNRIAQLQFRKSKIMTVSTALADCCFKAVIRNDDGQKSSYDNIVHCY